MRGKLSASILWDLHERGIFETAVQEDYPEPIWKKLQDPATWPKNMTFDLTPQCAVAMAWEAYWQMDQAKGWDLADAWVRGQITAGKFMLERMFKLMTEEQISEFNAKRKEIERPRW